MKVVPFEFIFHLEKFGAREGLILYFPNQSSFVYCKRFGKVETSLLGLAHCYSAGPHPSCTGPRPLDKASTRRAHELGQRSVAHRVLSPPNRRRRASPFSQQRPQVHVAPRAVHRSSLSPCSSPSLLTAAREACHCSVPRAPLQRCRIAPPRQGAVCCRPRVPTSTSVCVLRPKPRRAASAAQRHRRATSFSPVDHP
jgi:hypothetical protein